MKNNPQYGCSGSNIAAGLQSAINQLCPVSAGCVPGTSQIVLITDGISNCEVKSGTGDSNLGTSTVPGQNCPAGNTSGGTGCSTTASGMSSGDGQLLGDLYALAQAAGALGITLSTIYYSEVNSTNAMEALSGPTGKPTQRN